MNSPYHMRQQTIANNALDSVYNVLNSFPHRYQNFKLKNDSGVWSFNYIQGDLNYIVLQLVDATFEPPRQPLWRKLLSDAPYIHIYLQQSDRDVCCTYCLKWQPWKIIFSLVCLSASVFLFLILYRFVNLLVAFSMLYPIALLFIWFVQNWNHDNQTIRIFEQLLMRNFDTRNSRRAGEG